MTHLVHRLITVVGSIAVATALTACGTAQPSPPPAIPHTSLDPLELKVIGGPDWLVSTAGSIWVKRDDGFVTRLDPATGDVVAEVRARVTSTDGCNGLGVSDSAVWSCSGTDLVRIDPATNEVVEVFEVDKVFSQGRLVEAAGHIWVLTAGGGALVGVATTDGTVTEPVALPVPCTDLGTNGDALYAVCADTDAVMRIDPVGRTVTAKVSAADPSHVSASGSTVWVAGADGLLRLDGTSLATTLRVPEVIPGYLGGILADATGLWVRRPEPFLTRIEATGRAERVITAPYGGGDVLVDGGSVWASDNENGFVVRLAVPATG